MNSSIDNNLYDNDTQASQNASDASSKIIDVKDIDANVDTWAIEHLGQNFEFRQHQKEEIVKLIFCIINDSHIELAAKRELQIIEAPTGSGKSIICIVAAGVLAEFYGKSSYILCSDLYLWSQYADFIEMHNLDFGMLKGLTGNYVCTKTGSPIRIAPCKLEKISYGKLRDRDFCASNGYQCAWHCEYLQARYKASRAKVTLMTYQLWLYQMNLVAKSSENPDFPPRDIIFCDECHKIPSIVQSFCSPLINPHTDFGVYCEILKGAKEKKLVYCAVDFSKEDPLELYSKLQGHYTKMSVLTNNAEIFEEFKQYVKTLSIVGTACEAIEDKVKSLKIINKEISKEWNALVMKVDHYANLMCYLSDFITSIDMCGIDYMIKREVEVGDTTGMMKNALSFACVKEDLMTFNYLHKNAKFKVFLSATPGEKSAFDDNIGTKFLDNKSSFMDRIPSTFNFTNSPIYFFNRYKMSFKFLDDSFPYIVQMVEQILRNYKYYRGIIHSGSYKLGKRIYDALPDDLKRRLLCYRDAREKDDLIRKLEMTDNGVLIGPTLTEGVDLPDDGCRFIIIVKVPYPNTTDEVVQRKMQIFPSWYNSETSNAIIQAIGRGVRNEHDWCHSYILDACFYNLFMQTRSQYSEDFTKRLQIIP